MSMLDDPRQLDALLQWCQSDSRGGEGSQPLPSHAWSGLLISNMFQHNLKEWITEAVVLAAGEAILFFGGWSHKEGLPYTSARDIGYSLTGPINWARRTGQVEVTANMVQEGHWAIADAVMEKQTKARGLGHSQWSGRAIWSSAGACNVDDWMSGLDKGASIGMWEGPVTPALDAQLDVVDDAGDREHQRFLKVLPEAHPLQGLGVLIEEVIKALHTQQWWEHLAAVMDQHVWEGAFGWGSTCISLRMKRWRML